MTRRGGLGTWAWTGAATVMSAGAAWSTGCSLETVEIPKALKEPLVGYLTKYGLSNAEASSLLDQVANETSSVVMNILKKREATEPEREVARARTEELKQQHPELIEELKEKRVKTAVVVREPQPGETTVDILVTDPETGEPENEVRTIPIEQARQSGATVATVENERVVCVWDKV